ncbi:uncharacterized protein LOC101156085 isoform X2 [Oryzias latipes]|uniref:uncharacterized protein LOC101156085 isoform X2 n=1 Tax=Oryzias latipes TaxID=8090 RepID=UPI0005CC503B|nr:uncharacterized protein LOC101156085 isoform X2 [Oryzias latipes]
MGPKEADLTGFQLYGWISAQPLMMMDGRDLQQQVGCLMKLKKLPVWIIEHVWAHKIMDIREVVDSSSWPDVDSQPQSLEDSWRLRVTAAQVYSIMKSRDMQNFEKVLGFLETTHKLLPRLVPAIKHMKIVFGLKTMVIMWMLKEHKGMVETVSKIMQFFPNKLPQYQDQCSPREMFVMRKNHLDFRNLAQALAVDKERLDDYIKTEMEQQYGEHYAQKVEDRLLLYLHELEAALPGETYIDKIMRKESPVTEEEKLLLEVITSNSATIAATLRNLLHCARISASPENRNRTESSEVSETPLCGSSSLPKFGEGKPPCERHLEVLRSSKEPACEASRNSFLLLENRSDSSDGGRQQQQQQQQQRVGALKTVEEESRNQTSPPQFCSKHQRWVQSILRGCPDECSEELLNQIKASSSPLLFQSSSSSSSSQDLTPSDLVPCPQPAAQAAKPEKRGEDLRSGTDESLPQPFSSGGAAPPTLLFPVIRLVDIAPMGSSCSTPKSQTWSEHCVVPSSKGSSSPRALTSPRSTEPFPHMHTAPVPRPVSAPASLQPGAKKTFSKLSRKFRHAANTASPSQTITLKPSEDSAKRTISVNYPPSSTSFDIPSSSHVDVPSRFASKSSHFPSASPSKQELFSSKLCQNVFQQKRDRRHRPTRRTKRFPPRSVPTSSPISSGSEATPHRNQPSNRLQPVVALTRLSTEECRRLTAAKQGSSGEEKTDMQESSDSSFDVNALYSTGSSDSECDDSLHSDPSYRPHKKKESFLRL